MGSPNLTDPPVPGREDCCSICLLPSVLYAYCNFWVLERGAAETSCDRVRRKRLSWVPPRSISASPSPGSGQQEKLLKGGLVSTIEYDFS